MTTFRVNDIYPTIQGEGRMTGTPMMLIRLHGCPVGCHFCDTKETWSMGDAALGTRVPTLAEALGANPRWCELAAADVAYAAHDLRGLDFIRWALLTGGEPAEQALPPLVHALHDIGFHVALETSGTATGHLLADYPSDRPDFVTVSPKWDNPGGRPVLDDVLLAADEVKAVIGADRDIDRLLRHVERLGLKPERVAVQPMSGSVKATHVCAQAAIRHGFRVSIQTHKIMGLP